MIGRDHYKSFKSIDAIAKEKGKLVTRLPPDGIAVLNIDDPYIRSIGNDLSCKIMWVGHAEAADLRIINTESKWPEPLTLSIEYCGKIYEVKTSLHGKHLAASVMCALGASVAFGVSFEEAALAVSNCATEASRMEIIEGNDGVVFVMDDRKAPYWSLEAPLEFLRDSCAKRKVAVIGTLSDYSGKATSQYKKAASLAREYADLVVFVGPHAHRALRARSNDDDHSIQGFPSIAMASDFLRSELVSGDMILLKGSNNSDHLSRLFYGRYKELGCWSDTCRKEIFCNRCPRLYDFSATKNNKVLNALNDKDSMELNMPNSDKILVLAVGNPGKEYLNTPHNIGFMVADELARKYEGAWLSRESGEYYDTISENGFSFTIFKPSAKVNNTGAVLREVMKNIEYAQSELIVIHDDMDLKLGEARYKEGGGSSGHKGVQSIINAIQRHDFKRVRVGVRAEGDSSAARSKVLKPFSEDQTFHVNSSVSKAVKILATRISEMKAEIDGTH